MYDHVWWCPTIGTQPNSKTTFLLFFKRLPNMFNHLTKGVKPTPEKYSLEGVCSWGIVHHPSPALGEHFDSYVAKGKMKEWWIEKCKQK